MTFTRYDKLNQDDQGIGRLIVAADVTFTRYDELNQDDQGIWTSPGGDLVAWFVDPDGNTLSLTEDRRT